MRVKIRFPLPSVEAMRPLDFLVTNADHEVIGAGQVTGVEDGMVTAEVTAWGADIPTGSLVGLTMRAEIPTTEEAT